MVLLGEIDEERASKVLKEVSAEELAVAAENEAEDDHKQLVWDFE